MSNPPKKKGTQGETELLRALNINDLKRTPPTSKWDLDRDGQQPFEVLATRPDRGKWLITMRVEDFQRMWKWLPKRFGLRVEVKRYQRFAHHTIFESKFGGGDGRH